MDGRGEELATPSLLDSRQDAKILGTDAKILGGLSLHHSALALSYDIRGHIQGSGGKNESCSVSLERGCRERFA